MISSGLQVYGLGQTHKVCGGIKHVCKYSTIYDNGVKKQHKSQTLKNQLHKSWLLKLIQTTQKIANKSRKNKIYQP